MAAETSIIETETTTQDPVVLTVSDLNQQIKDMLEGRYTIVWVKGEISNFKPHTSGHYYFSLKDKDSQISAVMFRGHNSRLRFKPADGQEVVIRGRVTVYAPRGNYQVMCELMEPVGVGALQMAYEQLKAKLQKEGLFEAAKKRILPALPKKVALVTSPTGAAVKDMINVLSRRFKGLEIWVIPTSVQGANAPQEIVQAIQAANQIGDFDVMIVGRGGGSMEDLWAFNDEKVVRAIAASKIPTVSAVGHEIDFTIADFVADLRAPTPSAAAELIVKNAEDIFERVKLIQRQLKQDMLKALHLQNTQLLGFERRLVDPKRRLEDLVLRCDDLSHRLELTAQNVLQMKHHRVEILQKRLGNPKERLQKIKKQLELTHLRLQAAQGNLMVDKKHDLQQMTAVLDSLSPLKVVERGYSMVLKDGEVVKSYTQARSGDLLKIKLAKGSLSATVVETHKE